MTAEEVTKAFLEGIRDAAKKSGIPEHVIAAALARRLGCPVVAVSDKPEVKS
jgi:adenine/guanine phosphoribosyltransferase-like PRPP-binding protein